MSDGHPERGEVQGVWQDALRARQGLAQLVEPQVVSLDDAGSSPVPLMSKVKGETGDEQV